MPRSPRRAERQRRVARTGRCGAGLLTAALIVACGGAGTDRIEPPSVSLRPDSAAYLRPPWQGYPLDLSLEEQEALERGYEQLRAGQVAIARATAARLLERNPELEPAVLLEAQADFVEGWDGDVIAALAGWPDRERTGGWVPAMLLLGRAAERSGDPGLALRAYAGVRDQESVAARRLEMVLPSALQTWRLRLEDALDRGRVDEARAHQEELRHWGPEAVETWESALLLARHQQDGSSELEALRRLEPLRTPSFQEQVRRADLEVDLGESRVAIDILDDLVRRYPEEELRLGEALAGARFQYRLELLPSEVAQHVRQPSLTRGEFASLLYWLVPGVRTSRPAAARITTDVPLDHPQREAIVRVLNVGLMDLSDETLRRFDPEQELSQGEALATLLGLPSRLGSNPACLAGFGTRFSPVSATTCDAAVRCGLLADESRCQAGRPLGGSQSRVLLRRSLELIRASDL